MASQLDLPRFDKAHRKTVTLKRANAGKDIRPRGASAASKETNVALFKREALTAPLLHVECYEGGYHYSSRNLCSACTDLAGTAEGEASRSSSRLMASSRNSPALNVRLRASAIWPSSCAFIASDSNSLACLRSLLVGMRHQSLDSPLKVVPVPDIRGEKHQQYPLSGDKADIIYTLSNVCFWHKADIPIVLNCQYG
jgi:hypothetical protein